MNTSKHSVWLPVIDYAYSAIYKAGKKSEIVIVIYSGFRHGSHEVKRRDGNKWKFYRAAIIDEEGKTQKFTFSDKDIIN